MDLNGETLRWILGHGASLLIGTVVLLVVYRVGISAIHRLVPTVINAQAAHLPSGSSSDEEVGKRIRTIEDLLLRLLRMGVLAGFVVMVLAVFELWSVLTAIVLVIVAIVFATRDVVLDYVMGFLILIEGPYFKGDYVAVSGHPGIEGVVEEIGLRRTCSATRSAPRTPCRTGSSGCHPTRLACSRSPWWTSTSSTRATLTPPWQPRPASRTRCVRTRRGRTCSWPMLRPTSGSPGSAWTARRSGSSSGSRRGPRPPSRASFAAGWPRRLWRPRSGRDGGIRPCRS